MVVIRLGPIGTLVLMVALAGCGRDAARQLTPTERTRLRALQREMQTGNEAASERRLVTLRDAADSIRPSADAPPCPQELPAVDDVELRVRHSFLEVNQLAPGYDVHDDPHRALADPDEPSLHIHGPARRIGYRGRRAQVLENFRYSVEQRLLEGEWTGDGARRAEAMARFEAWGEQLDWELVILVEAYREPRHDGTEFLDGLVRGRAFLYDHAQDAVLCVGPVDAHNSESVMVRFRPSRGGLRGNQALLDDLNGAALASALAELRRVPPIPEQAPFEVSGGVEPPTETGP